ncbi:MAG: endonuclease III [Clostridia bacterium]|nr:endonuclease III [Clostridia bacterium]
MILSEQKRAEVLSILAGLYPNPRPELNYESPFELLIAVMLSAQCTDKMVNRVTSVLFPLANTPQKMLNLGEERLLAIIHPCGFFRMKGKHILETCQILVSEYNGQVPPDRDTLTCLPGVGRKTANVVVSNAFGIPAIAVDTHVFRVSNRIGLSDARTVQKTEEQLMAHIPQAKWTDAHHYLIFHGRRVCSAQRPKCAECTLNQICDFYTRGEGKC